MKKCAYCGKENDDVAEVCQECGEELVERPAADTSKPWGRIAVLGSEVEAERLEVELQNRDVPHVLVSYRDSALDGLYQFSKGWGQVEAPPEYTEAILSILKDMREGNEEQETAG